MNTLIVFLRGINISGKNKIAMADLKSGMTKLGFENIKTYLNSGNVLFDTEEENLSDVRAKIESMIESEFGFRVPCYVIEKAHIEKILSSSPEWWGTGNKDRYDNLIFILSDDTPEEIIKLVGEVSPGLERIEVFDNVIFWTFDRNNYQKCNWWKKTAGKAVADRITIRTAGTLKKICK